MRLISLLHGVADRIRVARGGDPRRLADGTPVRLDLLVVKDAVRLQAWGLAHAWDPHIHMITYLLRPIASAVELGPEQVGPLALRAAPRGASVTCRACATWYDHYPRQGQRS